MRETNQGLFMLYQTEYQEKIERSQANQVLFDTIMPATYIDIGKNLILSKIIAEKRERSER